MGGQAPQNPEDVGTHRTACAQSLQVPSPGHACGFVSAFVWWVPLEGGFFSSLIFAMKTVNFGGPCYTFSFQIYISCNVCTQMLLEQL